MAEPIESLKVSAAELFQKTQQEFCAKIEALDTSQRFSIDCWDRADGGGGDTRVFQNGTIFEQAGVNFSKVHGTLPEEMSEKLTGQKRALPFFATGISLVIHPRSPLVPTTHANLRFLQVAGNAWFGGGADLTPYYLYEDDARHFHQSMKAVCDRFDTSYYPRFKEECDRYFYLPHRGETRGVGGIFFDYCGREDQSELPRYFQLVEALAQGLPEFYLPIVQRRKDTAFSASQKEFQLLRRGRYVEFNLLYDRGTLFGLKTNGRTESILMSLPPEVRWRYDFQPLAGSEEARLLNVLRSPRAWA